MSRPPVALAVLLAFALVLGGSAGIGCGRSESTGRPPVPAATPESPNVLFILVDDLRWDTLGAYGNTQVKTPNLDRLATEGMRFDAFYVANPTCNASRANFLSGLHTFQPGTARGRMRTWLEDDVPTVATAMNAAGYRTAFIGKAHLDGKPLGWDFESAPLHHAGRQVFGNVEPDPFVDLFHKGDGEEIWVRGDSTELIANATIDYMREMKEQRFFLWVATTAPHFPYFSDPAHPYDPKEIRRPPGYSPDEPIHVRQVWADYYSLISTMDDQLGRVFEAIDALGLRDRTFVFFVSDNGLMHYDKGIAGKSIWWEASWRQPAIARWPGRVEPGSRTDAFVSNVDWLPTLLDLTRQPVPSHLEGKSFLPVLDGQPGSRKTVYAQGARERRAGGGEWRALREGAFKYVHFPATGEAHLFDLAADPFEREDLIADPAQADRAARMNAELVRFVEHYTQAAARGRAAD